MNNKILSIISCFVLTIGISTQTIASDWPSKNIKLTVGYGAGGTTDSTARVLASLLERSLGQKVTVLNKPGGGGAVAASLNKGKKADGYNVFTFTTGAAVLSPHMQDLPYDTLSDFTFIAQYAQWNLGVVVPKSSPFNSLNDLLDFAKAHPGKVSYAIAGTGTPQHLTMQRLAKAEGIDWKAIPYKGGAASVTALLGEHVDMMAGATEWLPQVLSGDFKLLAILTNKRMKQFPDTPTLLDLGYDISAPSILGIAGPKGIPKDVVSKLEKAIEMASKSNEMSSIINKLAMQTNYLNSVSFKKSVETEFNTQGKIIRAAGLGK
jgi:tripartite-type tricarboxylate transporter receptor subunit TctC